MKSKSFYNVGNLIDRSRKIHIAWNTAIESRDYDKAQRCNCIDNRISLTISKIFEEQDNGQTNKTK